MAPTEAAVELVRVEAVRVGPNDVLIFKLDSSYDAGDVFRDALLSELVRVGLQDRSFVIHAGAEVEMVVAPQDA